MIFESPNVRVAVDDQIATLWLDCRDNADNRLTLNVLDELERALRAVQRLPSVDILLLRSGKPDCFSIGNDWTEFAAIQNPVERSAYAARGQQVTQLLSHLGNGIITIALIEGACRLGGLELALACDYRIARTRTATRFALPDRDLGLLPCWGGTLRLPQLVGLKQALHLLLDSSELTANQALQVGLVDAAYSEQSFDIHIQALVDRLQDSPERLPQPRFFRHRLGNRFALSRRLSYMRAENRLRDVDAEERPAARAIVDCVIAGFSSPAEGLAAERNHIAALGETTAFRNAFEHTRRAEQPARVYPEPANPVLSAPERVGIVGDGQLSAALSCWLAHQGRQVVLQAQNEDSLRSAAESIDRLLANDLRAGKIDQSQLEQSKKSIRRTTTWNGFDEAGLVIEAVDEDLGVKRTVFSELEQRARPRAILASTSTSQRIEAIQAELERPGRVAGLHFVLNDLSNRIVEIVRAPASDSATLAALDAWLRNWNKIPIVVSDRPGRLVQRIQLVYLSEAVTLVAEGLPALLIDREMRRFGMTRGPLETIDAIGFDNLARLVEDLQLARGDRFCRNLMLDRMRAFGWNGRENEGFYRYRWGKARENQLARMVMWRDLDEDVISHYVFDPQESLNDGVDRLIMRTVNEAAACLAEEADADPGLIDLALAWGMGWAPHRGGPLRYADELGLFSVFEQLNDFTERFGKRFEPCVELQRRAEAGESFHESRRPVEPVAFPEAQRLAG